MICHDTIKTSKNDLQHTVQNNAN